MSAEAWVFLGVVVTGLCGVLVAWINRRDKPAEKPPPETPEQDPFVARFLARMDALEVEVKAERAAKDSAIKEAVELRSQVEALERQAKIDAETIRTLRARVDDLIRRMTA